MVKKILPIALLCCLLTPMGFSNGENFSFHSAIPNHLRQQLQAFFEDSDRQMETDPDESAAPDQDQLDKHRLILGPGYSSEIALLHAIMVQCAKDPAAVEVLVNSAYQAIRNRQRPRSRALRPGSPEAAKHAEMARMAENNGGDFD